MGSVTEAKRGKKYVLRWVESTPEGRKRKTMTVHETYRQACEELDRQHARVLEEKKVGCSTSIGYVYEHLWLPDALNRVESGDLKQSSMTMCESAWRNYVEPAWAGIRVDDVKPVKVQEWLADKGDGLPLDVGRANWEWSRTSVSSAPREKKVSMQGLHSSWRAIAEVEWGIPERLRELLMGHKLPGVTGSHYMRPDSASLVENFAAAFCSDSKALRTI